MDLQPQRDAFCASYNVAGPQLPLMGIAHWDAVLRHRGVNGDPLHQENAYVAPGYFYMPVSDEPDGPKLAELMDSAADSDWLLIPSLPKTPRNDAMHAAESIAVPFMQVAYFRTSGCVDSALRTAVGDKQYKAIRRITRKAEDACRSEVYRLSDISASHRALDDFAVLQALNGAKYRHSRNLYTREVLSMLARSTDAAKYYLRLDYDRASDVPLSGSLGYADEERAVFSKLVRGQDRDHVPDGINLYIADFYRVYQLASELGFDNICLGRGAIEGKMRLGANHIVDLVNWLIPVNTRRTREMNEFATAEMTDVTAASRREPE
ncbi:hypothetical protein BST36_02270 [Mycolicibacterium moriokaense]|nr:hypothetical protein [Mycolicibacterium moriokaense]MCV7039410.1 hypothetical protein [Mycolicibacterium moriokaense]ORB26956.1 hypothetical protein BST36_02270 [Mycolicibacterium moriokaense]